MRRRFWAAVGVGALLGGGGALGLGPYVRSQVAAKAERYGAAVSIQHVVPGWAGLHLKGVQATLDEVPGVSVWADDVVVGWTDRRARNIVGGRVTAVGSLSQLAADAASWRDKYLSGGGNAAGGGVRKVSLAGLRFEWRNRAEMADQKLEASDVSVSRDQGVLRLASASARARWGDNYLEVDNGRVALRLGPSGPKLVELSSAALVLKRRFQPAALRATQPLGAASASASVGGDESPPVSKVAAQRMATSKRALRLARQLAMQVDAFLDEDAVVAVAGARAELTIGDSPLNLGPGTLRVRREAAAMVVALEPKAGGGDDKPLTFSLRLPMGDKAAELPLEVRLVGGPVWLSLLGIREGDLGLVDVAHASIESDVKVVLPADGKSLSVDGRGKLHKLSLDNRRIAPKPLRDMEIAWRAKLDAQLDGSEVTLHAGEFDLGAVRFLLRGKYHRETKGHRVDMTFELPLVNCQSVLDALPKAVTSRVASMRLVGSLAATGHARLRTASVKRDYDVDWKGTNSCRVVDVPPELAVQRFKTSFSKTVYTPEGKPRAKTFGPDTADWAPLSSVTHFMEGAVLTTEDGRFFRHNGFDQEAIINSLQQNIEAGRFVRGASTISMQLAKNLYLPRTKTIARKLQEALLTLYLEQALTKNEMMELYLNVIEYGPMVYGIGPAARHYFNTSAGQLSLGQSLYLASILQNPKKQYFGAGGAVIDSRTRYLRRLMKIVRKIGRISDEELEVGLRETVIFGSPTPAMEPPEEEDPYEDDIDDKPSQAPLD